MDQFFKVALDQPAKAEKAFLWFLQSLIVLWILSVFFGWPIEYYFENGDKLKSDHASDSISAIDFAAFLVVFAITWLLLWLIFVDFLVQLLFYLLNRIIRVVRRIFRYIFTAIFYGIRMLLSIIHLCRKPEKFWKKNNVEEGEESYFSKMSDLRDILSGFTFLNKITNSVMGYDGLLQVISYEKGEFVQSRVIRYYSILLIVVIAKLNISDIAQFSILKASIIILTLLLGFIVFELNDIYSRLNTDDVHFLRPQLEFEIYKEYIFDSLSHSILIDNYTVYKKRRFINLSLKKTEDPSLHAGYFKQIIFAPIDNFVNNIDQFIDRMKRTEPDTLVVFVSEELLEIYQRNKIAESKYCYIQTTDVEQLQNSIFVLRPVFMGSIKL